MCKRMLMMICVAYVSFDVQSEKIARRIVRETACYPKFLCCMVSARQSDFRFSWEQIGISRLQTPNPAETIS